jgi:hypothetical protein
MLETDAGSGAPDATKTGNDDRKDRALALLVAGATPTEAAREVGVDRSTIWRWTREPAFARRFRETATERAQDAAARLDVAFTAAVGLLESVVSDDAHPIAVRVRAAEALIRRVAPPERPPDMMPTDPAERMQRLIDVFTNPHPEFLEALARAGWVRTSETNDGKATPDT